MQCFYATTRGLQARTSFGGIGRHVQTERPRDDLVCVRLDHAEVASFRGQNGVQDNAGRVQAFDVAEFCLLD